MYWTDRQKKIEVRKVLRIGKYIMGIRNTLSPYQSQRTKSEIIEQIENQNIRTKRETMIKNRKNKSGAQLSVSKIKQCLVSRLRPSRGYISELSMTKRMSKKETIRLWLDGDKNFRKLIWTQPRHTSKDRRGNDFSLAFKQS